MHNELDFVVAHIQLADLSDNETIVIDVHNSESKTVTYVKHNDVPSILNYDYKLMGEGTIKIKPTDDKYHHNGTFFLMVLPDFGFFDLFTDNYYGFTLQWRTEESVPQLTASLP